MKYQFQRDNNTPCFNHQCAYFDEKCEQNCGGELCGESAVPHCEEYCPVSSPCKRFCPPKLLAGKGKP